MFALAGVKTGIEGLLDAAYGLLVLPALVAIGVVIYVVPRKKKAVQNGIAIVARDQEVIRALEGVLHWKGRQKNHGKSTTILFLVFITKV